MSVDLELSDAREEKRMREGEAAERRPRMEVRLIGGPTDHLIESAFNAVVDCPIDHDHRLGSSPLHVGRLLLTAQALAAAMSSTVADAALSISPPPPLPLPLPISLPVVACNSLARQSKRSRVDVSSSPSFPPPPPPRDRSPVLDFTHDVLMTRCDDMYMTPEEESVILGHLTERKEWHRMKLAKAAQQREENHIKLTDASAAGEVARVSAAVSTSLAAADASAVRACSIASITASMAADSAITATWFAAYDTVKFDGNEIDAAAHGSWLDKHATMIGLYQVAARARVAKYNTLARAARQSKAKSAVDAARFAVAEEARNKVAAVAAASDQAVIEAAAKSTASDSVHAERQARPPPPPWFLLSVSSPACCMRRDLIQPEKTVWVRKSSRGRVPVVPPILASRAPADSSIASQAVIASPAADSAAAVCVPCPDRERPTRNACRGEKAVVQSEAQVAMEDTPKEDVARTMTVIAIELPIAAPMT